MVSVASEAVRRAAASIPPLAGSCQELLLLARDDSADAGRVAQLVERDERIVLELLRLANSAYFARPSRVTTVRGAVVMMGTHDALRAGIAVAMTGLFASPRAVLADAEVADACVHFARTWSSTGGEAGAAAGLLMPLGVLVLQQYLPKEFARFAACVGRTADADDLHALEHQLFGLTRCEALRAAASVWQLPDELTKPLSNWHVCSGVATPQYVATVAGAHTIEGAFFGAVALR